MDITEVSTQRQGKASKLNKRLLTTSVTEPQATVFRETTFLRFGPVGFGEALVIQPEATSFKGNFSNYDYNALTVNVSSLKTTPVQFGKGVKITFATPRHIKYIRIRPTKVPSSRYKLEFYRLDGEALAEEPTATAENGLGQHIKATQTHESLGFLISHPTNLSFDSQTRKGSPTDTKLSAEALAPFGVDFTDAQFVLKLKDPQGTTLELKPEDITEIKIRSYPTGPRLGIVFPADPIQGSPIDPSNAIFFWQTAGEMGTSVPTELGDVDAGEALGIELERGIARLLEQRLELLPEQVSAENPLNFEIGLILESDTPCTFNTTAFGISYLYAQESFTNGQEKQILRFDGTKASSKQISVQLPTGAVVTSAILETTESFNGPHGPLENDSPELFKATVGQEVGIHVTDTHWVAQCITHPEMRSIHGMALGLLPMHTVNKLQVEIQEDIQGQPSGRKLLRENFALDQPGSQNWAMLWFKKAIVLSTRPHWILLTAVEGQALWLTHESSTQICMVEKSEDPIPGTKLSTFKNIGGLHHLFSSPNNRPSDLPKASLSIGDQILAPTTLPSNAHEYDLRSPLNAYLENSQKTSVPMEIPLDFSATMPGMITIYPPRIEYDVQK